MLRVTLFVWLGGALQLGAQCRFPKTVETETVTYRFRPQIAPEGLIVHVTVELRTGATEITHLELPMHGSGEVLHSMSNLHAISHGASLEQEGSDGMILHAPPGRLVMLAYELRKDWTGPFKHPLQFHPVLMPAYMEFTGHNALVQPRVPYGSRETANFDWRGLPVGWNLATSFGTSIAGTSGSKTDRCQSHSGPRMEIDQGLYAAGDFRIHSFQIGRRQAVLAVRGTWTFPDEEAITDIRKVVGNVRDFWHDDNFPYFLVTLSPFDQDHGSSDGSAFTNAFWMYVSRLDSITGLLPQVAHESFHAWDPGRMGALPAGSEEESMKWFREGATEYYAQLLTYRAGELSGADYVKSVNGNLRAFSASNSEYIRGRILSLWLDATIWRESEGRHSLDDVMFDMVREADHPYTSARILSTADRYLSAESRTMLEAAVLHHADLPTPEHLPYLSECTHAAVESVPGFDVGFDLAKSLTAKTITGVVADGPAWLGGLRDGQQLVDSSVHEGEADRLVRLKIHTAEGDRQISFYPRGKLVPLELYQLDADRSCRPLVGSLQR